MVDVIETKDLFFNFRSPNDIITESSRVISVETASGFEVVIKLGSQTYLEDKATRRRSIFLLSPFLRIIILGNITIVK